MSSVAAQAANQQLALLENAIASSTMAGGALSEMQLAALLRKARGGFTSSAVLSIVLYALCIATLRLPFYEVTSSSADIDVTFSLPFNVEVCPNDSNLSSQCRYSSITSTFPTNGSRMSAASLSAFILIIVGLAPAALTFAFSLVMARRMAAVIGIATPSWQRDLEPHTRMLSRFSSPLVGRVLHRPRLPLRFALVTMACQTTATVVYLVIFVSWVQSAFPQSAYGAISYYPSIGFILSAVASFISAIVVASLSRAAKMIGVINMAMPSYLLTSAVGATSVTVGYVPVPGHQPPSVYVAAPGVTQGYAPMPMPMGAQAVAVPPMPADGGYYPTPQGQAMAAPMMQGYPQQAPPQGYYPPQGFPGADGSQPAAPPTQFAAPPKTV